MHTCMSDHELGSACLAHLLQGRAIAFLEPCRKWLKSGSKDMGGSPHRVPPWRMDKIGFGARLDRLWELRGM
jgi:hypothetical protein